MWKEKRDLIFILIQISVMHGAGGVNNVFSNYVSCTKLKVEKIVKKDVSFGF